MSNLVSDFGIDGLVNSGHHSALQHHLNDVLRLHLKSFRKVLNRSAFNQSYRPELSENWFCFRVNDARALMMARDINVPSFFAARFTCSFASASSTPRPACVLGNVDCS